MSFTIGKNLSLLVDTLDLSSYFRGTEVKLDVAAHDSTTYKKNSRTYVAGLAGGSVSLDGLYDLTADAALYAHLSDTTPEVMTVGPEGLAVGARAFLLTPLATNYTASAPVGDLVASKYTATASSTVGAGVSLHDLAAETTTGNGTGVDGLASSATGAVAHLHVSAFSGFSNVVVTVQDASASNFSDAAVIGTFTTVTGTTAQRITIAGTVRRYVRAVWTVTGSGSISFATAIART